MTLILRTIKFALRNASRNVWLTAATVVIMMLTLFSIVLVGAINLVGNTAIQSVEKKVDVTVFFYPDVSQTHVEGVQKDLLALKEVNDVMAISREEALEEFRQQNADNTVITDALDVLGDNPLGAHLIVSARSIDDFDVIIAKLESPEYNDLISRQDFEDHQKLVTRLKNASNRIQQIGVIVSSIFLFIAVLVIYNTIRITIYSQREEIGIQRLVGATNSFIRGPYVIESMFYAVISSVLTMGALYPFMKIAGPRVNQFFAGYNLDLVTYYFDNFWAILVLMIIVGLLISVMSTMVAITRYLRV